MSMISANNYQHIDFTYLNNLVMGDIDFKKKIINMFIDKTPATIKSLQELYKTEDWVSVKALAHKFKSSIDFVGSKDLAKVIVDLEHNAEKENKEAINKEIIEAERLCNLIYAELKTELSKL